MSPADYAAFFVTLHAAAYACAAATIYAIFSAL